MIPSEYNLFQDLYYQNDYASLYAANKDDLVNFCFEDQSEVFLNLAIKKPIHKIGNRSLSSAFYDLETPYGYGGPLSTTRDVSFLKRAIQAWKDYCHSHHLLAEFIRFHPYNLFPVHSPDLLDKCLLDRQVVCVNLQQSKEERWSEYSKDARNILRKAERNCKLVRLDRVDDFLPIYQQTMQRNQAGEFYYFDSEYFDRLLSLPDMYLLGVTSEQVMIAAGFFAFSKQLGHYHLSANSAEGLKAGANYFLLDRAFDLAKEKGCAEFLLGGGRSNRSDDNLFRFKKKFSKRRKDFYLGLIVHNSAVFDEYSSIWSEENPGRNSTFLLPYRQKA